MGRTAENCKLVHWQWLVHVRETPGIPTSFIAGSEILDPVPRWNTVDRWNWFSIWYHTVAQDRRKWFSIWSIIILLHWLYDAAAPDAWNLFSIWYHTVALDRWKWFSIWSNSVPIRPRWGGLELWVQTTTRWRTARHHMNLWPGVDFVQYLQPRTHFRCVEYHIW